MTGAIDYLSDGERVIAVENGHEFLGQVTGVRTPTDGIDQADSDTDWLRRGNDLRMLLDCAPLGQAPGGALRAADVRDRGRERSRKGVCAGAGELCAGVPGRAVCYPTGWTEGRRQLVYGPGEDQGGQGRQLTVYI